MNKRKRNNWKKMAEICLSGLRDIILFASVHDKHLIGLAEQTIKEAEKAMKSRMNVDRNNSATFGAGAP